MNLNDADSIKIAFIFQVGSFWPSWDSLYSDCIYDDRFVVKLFWIDGSAGDTAQMEHAEEFLVTNGFPYEAFSYEKIMDYKPHYMVYQTPYDKGHRTDSTWTARYCQEGIKIVYIPYGIEISDTPESRYKHFSLPVVLNAHFIFVLSEAIKKEYEKYCINAKAVEALGLPRFDLLRQKHFLSDDLKRHIAGRKMILWKVHFPKIFIEEGKKKQATPDLGEYIKFIRYIKENKDIFFVFMPHPKFADDTIDPTLLLSAEQILEEISHLSNVYIDKNDNYLNSLTNADAIIIDRSAMMVEAGATGVPVLYMYNSEYCEPMTKPIQRLIDSYYQGKTVEEMIDFCNMIRAGEDRKEKIRQAAFKECVPYFDGKCAERIKEKLWSDAKKEDADVGAFELEENSKIAMVGTGDICNYCMDILDRQAKISVNIVCFADNDKQKQGMMFYGKPIISVEKLADLECDHIVIASDKYYLELYNQLIKIGIASKKILSYDQFIVLIKYRKTVKKDDTS